MKKFIKTTFLMLLLVVICLTFCSCNALDGIRNSVGYYKGEDIVFRDEIYKKLPLLSDNIYVIVDSENVGYVTEDDVPVLLSQFFGNMFFYSTNGMIEMYVYDDSNYESELYYFCREDLYNDVIEVINSNKFNDICVSYYDYNNHVNKYQMLDEHLTEVFKKTLETNPIENDDNYFYDQNNAKYFGFDVNFCDPKMLVSNCIIEIMYDYTSGNYILLDTLTDNMYAVPQELSSDIETLTEKISDLQG